MNDFIVACFALFFGLAPLLLALWVRASVKSERQAIIRDLEKFFHVEKPVDASGKVAEDDGLLHSFEFVKFKYHVPDTEPHRDRGATEKNDIALQAPSRGSSTSETPKKKRQIEADYMADEWVLAGLPLFTLLVIANVIAASIIVVTLGLCSDNSSLPCCLLQFFKTHRTYRFALLASFMGAYTYMIRSFFQAINNFDLSPSSFFGAFNNIVFGLALPQVIFLFFVLRDETQLANPLAIGLVVITFFVGGYMPDAALRFVLQRSAIRYFKEERFDYGDRGKSTPIEVLDGIDSLIRFRLSDFHITTVQNLAAANPIMLFVETPFGIYQMIDWVAQAQLCASVGADRLFILWDLGIRTIFDLERVAVHDAFRDERLLWAIENVLFVDPSLIRKKLSGGVSLLDGPPAGWQKDAIEKNILARIDGVYTHRLRQIVIRIWDQIGGNDSRFLPTITLP